MSENWISRNYIGKNSAFTPQATAAFVDSSIIRNSISLASPVLRYDNDTTCMAQSYEK